MTFIYSGKRPSPQREAGSPKHPAGQTHRHASVRRVMAGSTQHTTGITLPTAPLLLQIIVPHSTTWHVVGSSGESPNSQQRLLAVEYCTGSW